MYEECGGNLSRNAEFGRDPLVFIEHAYESRNHLFIENQKKWRRAVFRHVHGQFQTTKDAIDYFYSLTVTLANQFAE